MEDAVHTHRIQDLIRRNDPSVLDLIYDTFGTRLYRYLLVLLGDESRSEEIIQELFVRLAENRELLRIMPTSWRWNRMTRRTPRTGMKFSKPCWSCRWN